MPLIFAASNQILIIILFSVLEDGKMQECYHSVQNMVLSFDVSEN